MCGKTQGPAEACAGDPRGWRCAGRGQRLAEGPAPGLRSWRCVGRDRGPGDARARGPRGDRDADLRFMQHLTQTQSSAAASTITAERVQLSVWCCFMQLNERKWNYV